MWQNIHMVFLLMFKGRGKKENCVDNFLPSVSKMHLNWTTMYVTWSLYSLRHNSDLLLFSKLSLCKTNSDGWWPALLSSNGSLGHWNGQHAPVFRWGFPAGKAVMENITLNIPKILDYSPKWLPKTAQLTSKLYSNHPLQKNFCII